MWDRDKEERQPNVAADDFDSSVCLVEDGDDRAKEDGLKETRRENCDAAAATLRQHPVDGHA